MRALQLIFGRFVEALGAAGGEDHARGRAGGGLVNRRRRYHGSLSWVHFRVAAGRPRRGLGRQRVETGLVRIVAMDAQQIAFGAVPVAGAAAVHAGPPVAIFFAVALAAEAVGFLERHALAAGQVQEVAVVGVVAIQAPAVGFVVLENDVGVHGGQLAPGAVGRHGRRGSWSRERCPRRTAEAALPRVLRRAGGGRRFDRIRRRQRQPRQRPATDRQCAMTAAT